ENLTAVMNGLKKGTLHPKPLRRAYVPKSPTKLRPLGIPAVRDRVAQEVLRRLLEPIFEPLFHNSSFGFRAGRNCHMAINAVIAMHKKGRRVVLDADIKGFFDAIPHKVIMQALTAQVADGNILRLVDKFLKAGVMENGVFKPTTIGTPQGGVISPLLANIVLNHLDWQLHAEGYSFARYADDFVVVCKTWQQAEEAWVLVRRVLNEDLNLQLNKAKTKITTYGKGYQFLGFNLSSRSRRMRPTSVKKFKDKIKQLTVRKYNFDQEVIKDVNRVIRGTGNFFATDFSTNRWLFQKLDSWIRMRLRCMKYKRKWRSDNWKFRRRLFRKLGLLSLEQFLPGPMIPRWGK
ncbi:MAG TPA: group II intron reverse transcriptase/maturase, partial [Desulfobacterales bacterium]|nr:group II intron reverse transcriptase/maturase [Desulfobacterales bacterium]